MAGQPPYKPFENDRLKWVSPTSELGGPILAVRTPEDLSLRKPAILVFLSARDTSSCCAANYERIVFRDRKVIGLAKKRFVTMRLNRDTLKKDVLARYKVTKKQPALLVLDCEGVVFARFDLCANSKGVLKALVRCLKASKRKAKATPKVLDLLDDAKKALEQPSYRQASLILRKVLRVKHRPQAAEDLARAILAKLEKEGERQYKEALGLSSVTEQWDLLANLRHEFWYFKPFAKKVGARMLTLQEGEATAETILDHRGNLKVEQALSLIKQGKGSDGRALLRKVVREFKGSPAAERARKELKRSS